MIEYGTGGLGIRHVFQIRGSVFPRAARLAVPGAVVAVILHYFLRPDDGTSSEGVGVLGMGGVSAMWGGYTFVLGFLIVFRNNQAYSRFWDGANTVAEIRGTWINATSNLLAFCSADEEMVAEVNHFQHLLVRLVSMMFCACLQSICELDDGKLQILDVRGIDVSSLEYLGEAQDKEVILMQWIQQLVVHGQRSKVLDIPAPILSRAFQDISQGHVLLEKVKNIRDVPFPFPYSQMIAGMLMLQWFVTPLLASQVTQSAWWAGILCFFVIGSFWSLMYIAEEIDMPFGSDENDLPVEQFMREFNDVLLVLVNPLTQVHPEFEQQAQREVGRQNVDLQRGQAKKGSTKNASWMDLSEIAPELRTPEVHEVLSARSANRIPVSSKTKADRVSTTSANFKDMRSMASSLDMMPMTSFESMRTASAARDRIPVRSSRVRQHRRSSLVACDEELLGLQSRSGQDSGGEKQIGISHRVDLEQESSFVPLSETSEHPGDDDPEIQSSFVPFFDTSEHPGGISNGVDLERESNSVAFSEASEHPGHQEHPDHCAIKPSVKICVL